MTDCEHNNTICMDCDYEGGYCHCIDGMGTRWCNDCQKTEFEWNRKEKTLSVDSPEDLGKASGLCFTIYGNSLKEMAEKFDGCPLKDEDGNIIGKVTSAEYDGEKVKVRAKLD